MWLTHVNKMKSTKHALAHALGILSTVVILSACGNRLISAQPQHSVTTTTMPSSVATECPIGDYKSASLAIINSIRTVSQACGGAVGALSWSDKLELAAAVHSNDMATNNYVAHTDAKGSRVGNRVRDAGYYYSYAGENIAAGQLNVGDVFALSDGQGWMSSSAHCKNIMTASHQKVALSCKYNPSSTYQYYWTLVLAN